MPGISSLRMSSDVLWLGMRVSRSHLAVLLLLGGISLDTLAPGGLRDSAGQRWYLYAVLWLVGSVLAIVLHSAVHRQVASALGLACGPVDVTLPGTLLEEHFSPPDPRSEALVALAGSAVSMLLTVTLGALWIISDAVSAPTSTFLAGMTLAVGGITLLNLLPGYPLDGGRVLRAFIWYLTDNIVTATRWAAFYAQIIGMVTMLIGFLLLALGERSAVIGAWMLLLGWSLERRSRDGLLTTVWHELGRTWSIDDAELGFSRLIAAETRIEAALDDLLRTSREGPLLITDGDVVMGTANLGNLRPIPRQRWKDLTLGDIASPVGHLVRIDDQQLVGALIAMLDATPQQPVLIEHQGRVRGIIDRTSLYARMQSRAAFPVRKRL